MKRDKYVFERDQAKRIDQSLIYLIEINWDIEYMGIWM